MSKLKSPLPIVSFMTKYELIKIGYTTTRFEGSQGHTSLVSSDSICRGLTGAITPAAAQAIEAARTMVFENILKQ